MRDRLQDIVQPVLNWYDDNRRELPWRQDRDPYHVWISEIMLQQTRIEAVMRYYRRFIEALPDIASLSEVDDDVLLKLWEGLGYYSRARNLKKAAETVMRDFGGVFPSRCEEIRRLPGIGDYTAGAIASICYNEKVTAVDGNVLRVIARVTASRENVLLPAVKKETAARLLGVIPERSGDFNEGLMELGELVCLPNGEPRCAHCPLSHLCAANRGGLWAQIPVREKKLRRKREDKTVFLLSDADGRIAVEKRPSTGLLSGMYQLPNLDGFYSEKELYNILGEQGLDAKSLKFIKNAKHVFTHIDWYMKGYAVCVKEPDSRYIWVTRQELEDAYPLPAAFSKFL